MKGFFSVLLVAAALSIIVPLLSFYVASHQEMLDVELALVESERVYYDQLSARHAFLDTIRMAAGSARSGGSVPSRDEIVISMGARLSELEAFVEANGLNGARVDLWCGVITEGELNSLPGEMLARGRPLKCAMCWDFSARVFSDKGAVSKCASFVDVDTLSRRAGVSMGGLEVTRDAEVAGAAYSGRWVLGASILDERGFASIAFLQDGTWVGY